MLMCISLTNVKKNEENSCIRTYWLMLSEVFAQNYFI